MPRPALALHNPALLDRTALVEQFLLRRDVLADLVERVRCAPQTGPRHVLLVGGHGMGKTMLLHRLAILLENDPQAGGDAFPVLLLGESFSLADLADLWLQALRTLEAQEAGSDLYQEIEALLGQELSHEALADKALERLRLVGEQRGKRPVLLVDGLDRLLDQLPEEDTAKLLRLLANDERILVVAAARVPWAGRVEAGRLRDLFNVVELRPLTREEMFQFLLRIAESRGDQAAQDTLRHNPGRAHGLWALTGGSPRLGALCYGIVTGASTEDLLDDLLLLLDALTPEFRLRLAYLSPLQRRIFDAVARRWHPVEAADLTRQMRMPSNAISAQIYRLVQEGYVEEVGRSGRQKSYQVVDRLLSVYCILTSGPQGRRELRWLLSFLRAYYNPGQAGPILEASFGHEVGGDDAVRNRATPQPEVASAVTWAEQGAASLRARRFVEAERTIRQGLIAAPDAPDLLFLHAVLLGAQGRWPQALLAIEPLLRSVDELTDDQPIIRLLIAAAGHGRARDVSALLDSTNDLAKRWLPLRAALAVASGADPDHLRRLAPEARSAAEEILTAIRRGDAPQGEETSVSQGLRPPPVELCLSVEWRDTRKTTGPVVRLGLPAQPPGRPALEGTARLPLDARDLPTFLHPMLCEFWADDLTASGERKQRLRRVGTALADHLLPSSIRQALASDRFAAGTALHIDADEAWLPWELIWLGDAFLGERFAVTRWPRSVSPQDQVGGPEGGLVATRQVSLDVQAERRALQELFGAALDERNTPGEVLPVLRHDAPLGVMHFACHGQSREALVLQTGPPDINTLLGNKLKHPLDHALVFLNLCYGGLGTRTLWDHEGWADAFLRKRVGAVVAPCWQVAEGPAVAFAEAFYQSLASGTTLGEAARLARGKLAGGGHPDRLAYSVYAAPTSRFTRAAVAVAHRASAAPPDHSRPPMRSRGPRTPAQGTKPAPGGDRRE